MLGAKLIVIIMICALYNPFCKRFAVYGWILTCSTLLLRDYSRLSEIGKYVETGLFFAMLAFVIIMVVLTVHKVFEYGRLHRERWRKTLIKYTSNLRRKKSIKIFLIATLIVLLPAFIKWQLLIKEGQKDVFHYLQKATKRNISIDTISYHQTIFSKDQVVIYFTFQHAKKKVLCAWYSNSQDVIYNEDEESGIYLNTILIVLISILTIMFLGFSILLGD